jgi:copper chaperone
MQTIELKISGMTCGACVSHVTKALQSVTGVQSAVVDLAGATAHVSGDGYGAQPSEGAAPTPSNSIPLTATGCSCCD